MAVKRPRPIQSTQSRSVLMFDNPSEIRSVFKYFSVLVGFGPGKCGGIPDVKDGCLSPTSPLDFKGFSRYSSGVGLGILVALDHDDNNEQKKAMPIVSVKLPSLNKLGKTEENGGRLCRCKEMVIEDSGPSDFLYACYLCRRKLSTRRIYTCTEVTRRFAARNAETNRL